MKMGELVNHLSLELQLKPILQHVQVLIENQSIENLQTFLNEVNTFLLNLKTLLDVAFTTTTLRGLGEKTYVRLEKPLTAIFSFKEKVILKLREPDEIDNSLDIKEELTFVKLETVNDNTPLDNDTNKETVKDEFIGPDYIENASEYDDINDNPEQETIEEDPEDEDQPKSKNFYKKNCKSSGYHNSFPISREEYKSVVLKGKASI